MKRFRVERSRGRFKLQGFVQELGKDLLVSIWGGTTPHIGAVGIGIPRPSLKNPMTWSATSSNFTFLGHKEDSLVRAFSETLASRLRRNVVVVAGIHWDRVTAGEIKIIENLSKKILGQIQEKLA